MHSVRAIRPLALLGFATTLLLGAVALQVLVTEHAAGSLLDVADCLVSHALCLVASTMVVRRVVATKACVMIVAV